MTKYSFGTYAHARNAGLGVSIAQANLTFTIHLIPRHLISQHRRSMVPLFVTAIALRCHMCFSRWLRKPFFFRSNGMISLYRVRVNSLTVFGFKCMEILRTTMRNLFRVVVG